jgi:hypothetical protein
MRKTKGVVQFLIIPLVFISLGFFIFLEGNIMIFKGMTIVSLLIFGYLTYITIDEMDDSNK